MYNHIQILDIPLLVICRAMTQWDIKCREPAGQAASCAVESSSKRQTANIDLHRVTIIVSLELKKSNGLNKTSIAPKDFMSRSTSIQLIALIIPNCNAFNRKNG